MSRQSTTRHNQRYQRHSPTRSAAAYYSHDSAARQVAPQPQTQPRPQRKTKQRPQFDYDIRARHRENFMSYVLLAAFFVCLAAFLAIGARYEYGKVQLEQARTQLVALQSINTILSDAIYADLDMDAIEAFAIYELGMGVPEEFQLMEIHVQPQSFFVHTAPTAPQTGNFDVSGFWRNLFSFAGGD